MGLFIDLTGHKFHRLTVLRRAENRRHKAFWHCRCDCGNELVVSASDLKRDHAKSCGCLNLEVRRTEPLKHGYNRTPTYVVWTNMIARCENSKRRDYKNYGGRGISVCEKWRASFSNFLEDMGEKPVSLSIDRIDVNGNYEPGNCRWATAREQRCNQRKPVRAAASLSTQQENR